MTELIWDGKYVDGKKQAPVRVALPFQTIETVNESAADRQRTMEMFASGRETEWRNRLIWGDKKYVLPSLLPEFAGKVDLIYVDPPFDTGADFSYLASVPHRADDHDNEAFALANDTRYGLAASAWTISNALIGGVASMSRRFIDTCASPSTKNPLACTEGSPPLDARIFLEISRAIDTSGDWR